MTEIEQAIATALEDFELVVKTFDEARRLEVNEVIGNLSPETVEGIQEGVKTIQAASTDPGLPVAQEAFGTVLSKSGVKDSGQVFAQGVGHFEAGRERKQAVQYGPLIRQQVVTALAKSPQGAFEGAIRLRRECALEAFHFSRTQAVSGIPIQPGDMETVNNQASVG